MALIILIYLYMQKNKSIHKYHQIILCEIIFVSRMSIRLGFGNLRRTNKRFANVADSCINYVCAKSDSSHIG
jgi:hypothetical protein